MCNKSRARPLKLRALKAGESFRLHGITYIKGSKIELSFRNDKQIETVECKDLDGEILFIPLDIYIGTD